MIQYTKPVSGEYSAYFDTYLSHLIGDDRDVMTILQAQNLAVLAGLEGLADQQADYRYESGKWSVKDVIGHVLDTERLFAFRALWIARGEPNLQPGMDENIWAANSNAGKRSCRDLREEYRGARQNHMCLFGSFDAAALARQSETNNTVTTVNAIPWIIAAHELHHLKVLRDRYGIDFLPADKQGVTG